nr:nuclear pore complex protein NUP88-like [Coffea arabica]
MRFNFNFIGLDDSGDGLESLSSPSTSTPKEDVEWLPLQHHPIFTSAADGALPPSSSASSKTLTNLLAWDGASRLYFWDSQKQCLHRISVQLGEPDPSSILAASPSKVLQADVQLNYEVQKISINRHGSAMLLSGSDRLCVMYLYGKTSVKDNIVICRTVTIGAEIYFHRRSIIRMLQVYWHPSSDTHLGILSSDSVFRIFNLSMSLQQPEQEYYLQPVKFGSSTRASSICPVDFSFGGNHLWDRFSVFILFSDGSVYVLCPIIPFGSVYKWEALQEIYVDAKTFGLNSTNSKAVSNINMAISWLEAIFPELSQQSAEGGDSFALKARPYAFIDSSIVLQGPLRNFCHGEKKDTQVQDAEGQGRAVSFLYNLVSKDSVLVIAWSGGQLQIDAFADEIQPVWKAGSPPRLFVDSCDRILGIAMICESVSSHLSFPEPDSTLDRDVWMGHPPPLLRLAIVDLALPGKGGSHISMSVDPLMPERTYCFHNGGIDSVVLHFLPFSSQSDGKDGARRSPSVNPVISACHGESSSTPSLCGFLALADSFGDSWIVGVTYSRECIVLEMENWNLLLPPIVDEEKNPALEEEKQYTNSTTIISKELLSGPKVVLLPPSSPNLRSVTADSIEGRSTLHQYFKLFHENYMEYAYKVYFELQHHAPQLKKIIDNQHSRLQKAEQKLLEVEEKQEKLESRITNAVQHCNVLEERLLKLRNLPGIHKKPLSKAERDFKAELDRYNGVELDALRSSIEALDARLKRFENSQQANVLNQHTQVSGKRMNYMPAEEVSKLRSSIEKLSLVNNENTKMVKLIESALRNLEINSTQ